MPPAYQIPTFSLNRSMSDPAQADLVAFPVSKGAGAEAARWTQLTGSDLAAALDRGAFVGKLGETWTSSAGSWGGRRLLFVGAGPLDELSPESARRLGATVAMAARQQRFGRIGMIVPSGPLVPLADSLVEGIVLGNFDGGHHKSKQDEVFFVTEVALMIDQDLGDAIERGARLGDAINAARVLINEPGNRLTPREFVARGQALLAVPHVTTEVLDEQHMQALGMGLLLGVGQGSVEPPRLLIARYNPPGVPASPVLALVGKGVTFDTGGISIKPADGMERMKDDMAGGAAVMAALRAVALEGVPLRAMAVVPAVENMPSGSATKPGDVHRGAAGITVEINNTDAEGRLILGDALWYARQQGATHLIDVATLTGACIVALGKITTGLFATEGWREVIVGAAATGGEKIWPMPIFEEYKEALKSEVADLLNSPGRPAGAVTAAMFLKEFTGSAPWGHLDIAGTAWADETRPWSIKGATGVMVRTLVEVARTRGAGWPSTL